MSVAGMRVPQQLIQRRVVGVPFQAPTHWCSSPRTYHCFSRRTDDDLDHPRSYACRFDMSSKSRLIQVPPGKRVRKIRAIQIPPGKHDLDLADRMDSGIYLPQKT